MSIFGFGGGLDNMIMESDLEAEKAISALEAAADRDEDIYDYSVQEIILKNAGVNLKNLTEWDIKRIEDYFN